MAARSTPAPESFVKTCIVTGGASGIGLATTQVLLDHGWRVAAFDRDPRALAEAAIAVGARDVGWHRVDITDEAAVAAKVAELDAMDQGVDDGLAGLVNCAGVGIAKRFVDTTADDLRRMYEINVVGTFIVAQAVVRVLRSAGRRGAIVNLASTAGQRGNAERSAYGPAKGAVIVLTQVMALELAADGIRVNAVSPGPVATPLVDAMHTEATRARWTALVPQQRYAEPREIAEAIAFLLDDAKSSFVTGHVLNVDGGLMAAGLMD
jgi:NAD(P)-dependent dehydrogenase (short-subunit alcohol dehydrogenase family)